MLGLFLTSDAPKAVSASSVASLVKKHALEVLDRGYSVIERAIPESICRETIAAFRRFETANDAVFSENRNADGHYPRIINLHLAFPDLLQLFIKNTVWLQVQDLLFGAQTALYTSIFYEIGSQQPLHRDTPVFSTRPEYLYFGSTVYLEPADEDNGCLQVLEGGHKLPELDRAAMAVRRYGSVEKVPSLDNDLWIEYQDTVVAQSVANGLEIKKLYVGPGDTLIWHPQLPHGGTAIKDLHRTRFSWVIHTTPVGVPVYHQNVFFNPKGSFSEKASWDYREIDGRYIADFRHGVAFDSRTYSLDHFHPI